MTTNDPADVTIDTLPAEPFPSSTGATRSRRRPGIRGLRRTAGGVGAVGVKELRGRMRGRRAFAILSLFLLLLAGFAFMVELMMERTYVSGFGGNAAFASAAVGQGIFAALLMLETLLVVFLAPLATAGSISLEREKQTLEMLTATPITSFAIVFGKLLSALVWVWLLIAASIPLTAVVFVFGGVAPDDLVRGYVVLVVTALGFGAFGLFCSSVVKRTQAATAVTIFGVLAVTMGTLFVIYFWQALATADPARGVAQVRGAPPAPLVYLNPFLAQADVAPANVLCASDTSLRYYCRFREVFLPTQGVIFLNGTDAVGTDGGWNVKPGVLLPVAQNAPANVPIAGGGVVVERREVPFGDVAAFGVESDAIWQQTVVAWLVLSLVFLLLSVQFVSPTRRWRLRRDPPRSGGTA